MRPAGSTDQRINRSTESESGVTLVELLVVMAIVGVMMAVAYPNFTSGLEGIKLKSAASRAATFWAEARQRADRFQEVVQVTVDPKGRELRAASAEGSWQARFPIDDGLFIARPAAIERRLLYPGTPSPRLELLLGGESGGRAGMRVNVLTGVAEVWDGEDR